MGALILAHSFGEGGPEIEFLILAAGMVVLAITFFLQKTTKPQVPLFLLIGAVAVIAGAFAFEGDAPTGSAGSTEATVAISAPAEGEVVPAGEPLRLAVELSGGTLIEASSSSDPNAGHLHVYLDGGLVSMPSVTDPAIPAEQMTPGEHEIKVEFTQADHRSFEPRVLASVTVTAE